MKQAPPKTPKPPNALLLALALALGAAVAIGVTRFAYGLLLPPMRADLGWSYTLAGAMNTANAVGYLLGALCAPVVMRLLGLTRVFLLGALLGSVFMGLSGFFTAPMPLMLQRLLAGVASAFVFVAGGLLVARLAATEPKQGGLLLGLFYGGSGLGIVVSALLVPAVLDAAEAQTHGWAWAWWALAFVCLVATGVLAGSARALQQVSDQAESANATATSTPQRPFVWREFSYALAGYGLFGVGYIGYMTFVIALLREQGAGGAYVTVFYALLGLAVAGSSRVWAKWLDRFKGGQVLATNNALLGLATVLPALTSAWPMVMLSGLVFGGVFLSAAASTTAMVRHNLPPSAWGTGISAFTVVFAVGQIVGPTMVGWIADGPGGLPRGLMYSAVALWLGALLAWRQRAIGG